MNLQLPYPPSVNTYWRHCRGRTFVSRAGKLYQSAVCALVGSVEPITRDVAIAVIACPPDARKRDLDNLLKATLDALTAAKVWVDDNQVKRIELRWGKKIKGGCLEIAIEEMEA
jgi:crossover junction endodeoxyribonuclease RusA